VRRAWPGNLACYDLRGLALNLVGDTETLSSPEWRRARLLKLTTIVVALLAACTTAPSGTSTQAARPPTSTAVATSAPPTSAPQAAGTAPAPVLSALSAFQKGMTFADWRSFDAPRPGLYLPAYTDQSLKDLAATGADWISLVVGCGQETLASTTILCRPPRTATDSELRRVVDLAHTLGLRVMLKPQLDFSNEPDVTRFRGHIGTAFADEAQWRAWFASYRQFIGHYAGFSQEAGVDMLCIGVELGGTTHREEDWRQVVDEVRASFKGPITYAALSSTGAAFPHGEGKRITWWGALDFIGIDAYYPLANRNDPTVADLKSAWATRGYLTLLEDLSRRLGKRILLTEFGYRSIDGAARAPGAYQTTGPVDLQEQADAYQAALEVLWGRPWLAGIFWWQWPAIPNSSGPSNTDFTPAGKPAEHVLRSFYLRPP